MNNPILKLLRTGGYLICIGDMKANPDLFHSERVMIARMENRFFADPEYYGYEWIPDSRSESYTPEKEKANPLLG
jgi:hypothetical protein